MTEQTRGDDEIFDLQYSLRRPAAPYRPSVETGGAWAAWRGVMAISKDEKKFLFFLIRSFDIET